MIGAVILGILAVVGGILISALAAIAGAYSALSEGLQLSLRPLAEDWSPSVSL